VFPNAEVKIFLDADPEVRATRRLRELQEKGTAPPAAEVAREIRERDHRDSTRADSPLVPATDAIRLDTTALSLDQVEQVILEVIESRQPSAISHRERREPPADS
jgi:cytidylate kinase